MFKNAVQLASINIEVGQTARTREQGKNMFEFGRGYICKKNNIRFFFYEMGLTIQPKRASARTINMERREANERCRKGVAGKPNL